MMKKAVSSIVQVAEAKGQSTLSRAQKLFNKLIKKIEQERNHLKSWQEAIPIYQQKYNEKFDPALALYNQRRIELVVLLDQAFTNNKFSKMDQAKLSDLICCITEQVIAEADDQPSLKEIYNRHSGGDFDAELAEEQAALKTMMEEMLGVEIGDDLDFSSPEAVAAHMHEKMQHKMAEQEQHQQAEQERLASRKKSSKTLAKEAKQEQENKNVSLSIREVYRKLASALHPDREPDEAERERKTSLMQRVNIAYDKQDLLGLLELQLEVEQIDQSMLNTLSEDRLKYFNKILTEQAKELEYEVDAIERSFKMRFNIPEYEPLHPQSLLMKLQKNIVQIRHDADTIKQDLLVFKDVKNIKAMLKTYRIAPQSFGDEALFDESDFAMMFGKK